MIRGMRRGRSPTADRLRGLCEVLDLEFYVARRREPDPLDERRLELAVETAERGLSSSRRILTHAEKARFFVAVYQLIGEEHVPANAARVRSSSGSFRTAYFSTKDRRRTPEREDGACPVSSETHACPKHDADRPLTGTALSRMASNLTGSSPGRRRGARKGRPSRTGRCVQACAHPTIHRRLSSRLTSRRSRGVAFVRAGDLSQDRQASSARGCRGS